MDYNILKKIEKLEKEEMKTFSDIYSIDYEPDINEIDCFLYHGLRNQNNNNKLEGILKERKILAGKYLDNYSHYCDNCNDGKYVSLINYNNSIEFDEFVKKNTCLIISPLCNAYKTKYLTFNEWFYMKENNIFVKNRYSYAVNEYQVKDFIPIEMIRAIGIPYTNIRLYDGMEKASKYLQDIIELLDIYKVELPIVDTSYRNRVLYKNNSLVKKYKLNK